MPETVRNFALTPSDWTEIYNALSDETRLKRLIVEETLNSGFSDRDWLEIYLCVRQKRERLAAGLYGRDRASREWRDQLTRILAELDPIRAEYIGGAK